MSNILTLAECTLVNALLTGHTSNKQLAAALEIRPGTVRSHCAHIFDKAGVQNKIELVLWALRNGWCVNGLLPNEHPIISRMPHELRRIADEMEAILK